MMEWEWVRMSHGDSVPENAVYLHEDFYIQKFIARAKPKGKSVNYPGHLHAKRYSDDTATADCVYIKVGGSEQTIDDNYEVLVAPLASFYWSPYENSLGHHHDAYKGCQDENGEILYITRVYGSYGYCGGFGVVSSNGMNFHVPHAASDKFEILMIGPPNLRNDSQDKKIHEMFGWTQWSDQLNLKYVVSAGGDGDTASLVGREDGCNHICVFYCLESKSIGRNFFQREEGYPTRNLYECRIEVLLATPGHYFWTVLPSQVSCYPYDTVPFLDEKDRTKNKNWTRCVGRATYRGRYVVGEVGDRKCYLDTVKSHSEDYEFLIVKRPRRSYWWASCVLDTSSDLVRIEHDTSKDPGCTVSRTLLPTNEYSFEITANDPYPFSESTEFLVSKMATKFAWVPDKFGFVPHHAVLAGQRSITVGQKNCEEPLYFGRFEQGNQKFLGLVQPFDGKCVDFSSDTNFSHEYEVLVCAVNETNGRRPKDQKISQLDQLLRELGDLQNKYFHMSNDSPQNNSFHYELSQLQDRCEEGLFQNNKEWIPFLSRITRIHRLPKTFHPVLFRFMIGPCNNNSKQRVGQIIQSCNETDILFPRPVCRIQLSNILPLINYLNFMGENQMEQSSSQIEAILHAIVVGVACGLTQEDVFFDRVQCSIEKFLKRFSSFTTPASKLLRPGRTKEPLRNEDSKELSSRAAKIEKLKIRSLRPQQSDLSMVPIAYTVFTVQNQIEILDESLTEKEEMPLHDWKAFYNEAPTDLKEDVIWTWIADTEKSKDHPADNVPAVPSSVIDMFTARALECSQKNQEDPVILAILTSLIHATGKFSLEQPNLEQLLDVLQNLNRESKNFELIAQLVLRLIHSNVKFDNFDRSSLHHITQLLLLDNSKQIRIQSAELMSHLTVNFRMPLSKEQLQVLNEYIQDDVRDVKLHARVALANGLCNNEELCVEHMMHFLEPVFVTNIVEITDRGGIQRDLTGQINGTIYKICQKIQKIPSRLKPKFRKFFTNFANSFSAKRGHQQLNEALDTISDEIPSKELLQDVIRILTDTEDEILYSRLINFICNANTSGVTEFTIPDHVLQKTVKLMRMSTTKNTDYMKALHLISASQELPNEIFYQYHMELIGHRLESGRLRGIVLDFLSEQQLDKSDDRFLLKLLGEYYKRGWPPSRMILQATFNCLEDKKMKKQAMSTVSQLTSQHFIFSEQDLEIIMSYDNKNFYKDFQSVKVILENQDIPRKVIQDVFKRADELSFGNQKMVDSLLFVHLLLIRHSNPSEIIERCIKLSLRVLNSVPIDETDKNTRVIFKCLDILHSALVTQEVPSTYFQEVKYVIMMEKKPGVRDRRRYRKTSIVEDCVYSDLELMVDLMAYEDEKVFFCWREVNTLVLRAGLAVQKLDEEIEKRLYQLYRCNNEQGCNLCSDLDSNLACGKIGFVDNDERAHVYFDVLALKFSSLQVSLIKSACNFVKSGGNLSSLGVDGTTALQRVLQKNSKVAVNIRSEVTNQSFNDHLQNIGDCVFDAWCYSEGNETYNNCLFLLNDVFNHGWRPSEKAKLSLSILNQCGGLWIEKKLGLNWPTFLLEQVDGPVCRPDSDQNMLLHVSRALDSPSAYLKDMLKPLECLDSRPHTFEIAKSISRNFTTDMRFQAVVHILLSMVHQSQNMEERRQLYDQLNKKFKATDANLFSTFNMILLYIEESDSHFNVQEIDRIKVQAFALLAAIILEQKLQKPGELVGRLISVGRFIQAETVDNPLVFLSNICSINNLRGFDELIKFLGQKRDLPSLDMLHLAKSDTELIKELTDAEEGILKKVNVDKLTICYKQQEDSDHRAIYKLDQDVRTQDLKSRVKPLQEFIAEFACNNHSETSLRRSSAQLFKFITEVKGQTCSSILLKTAGDINLWNKETVKSWASAARTAVADGELTVKEYLSVARRTLEILRGWRLTSLQVLAVKTALNKQPKKAQLQQISTGSGKSTIIALVAAFKAICGDHVDIFTSSPVLAQRDREEWAEFYDVLSISCANIEDEANRKKIQQCYGSKIVYGDIKQFQFDVLRQDYRGIKTRGGRRYKYCIIDEVDTVLLDEASKIAILSTPVAGMELLDILFTKIWKCALRLNKELNNIPLANGYYTYQGDQPFVQEIVQNTSINNYEQMGIYNRRCFIKQQLELFIAALLGKTEVQLHKSISPPKSRLELPAHLQEFANSELSYWACAALTALTLQIDKDYVVLEEEVFPLDPNNGLTQKKSKWPHGLHQFLQIKHQLRITPQNLTSVFISNKGLIDKYHGNWIGFSGTLGLYDSTDRFFSTKESASQRFFHSQNIEVFKMPDLYIKRFWMAPTFLATSKDDWLRCIVEVTSTELKLRGVLIICSTIKNATEVERILRENNTTSQILLYVQSEEAHGKDTTLQIDKGTVIVTTSLGARGTDIKVTKSLQLGLHVIVTYLPSNKRAEAQAFGRTARQGNYGSGQFIIKCSKSKMDSLPSLGKDEAILEVLQDEREKIDEEKLKALESNVYPFLTANDDACFEYMKSFKDMLSRFRKKPNEAGLIKTIKKEAWKSKLCEFDWAILDAYHDSWAFHFNKFKTEKKFRLLETGQYRNAQTVFELTKSCFHPIRYGFEFYKGHSHFPMFKTTGASKFYFELAIKYDPAFAAGAHVGLAYVALRGHRILDTFQTHEDDYKEYCLDHLNKSLILLSKESAQLQAAAAVFPYFTPAGRQFDDKIDFHAKYMNTIMHTRELVEKSLRTIYCERILLGDDISEVITLPPQIKSVPFEENLIKLSYFTLSSKGLTFKKDGGKNYQGIKAIRYVQEELLDRQLISFELTGTFNLQKFANWNDKFGDKLTKIFQDDCRDFVLKIENTSSQQLSTLLNKASSVNIKISGRRKNVQEATAMISEVDEKLFEIYASYYDVHSLKMAKSDKLTPFQRKTTTRIDSLQQLYKRTGEDVSLALNLSFGQSLNALPMLRRLTTVTSLQIYLELKVEHEFAHLTYDELFALPLVSVRFPKLTASKCLEVLKILKDTDIDLDIHFHHLNYHQTENVIKKLSKTGAKLFQKDFISFNKLYTDCKFRPADILAEMKHRGLDVVAQFDALNGFRPTAAIFVGLAVVIQLSAVGILVSSGAGVFATPLLAGVISDMWKMTKSLLHVDDFSFKSYAVTKLLGVALGFGFTGLSEILTSTSSEAVQNLSKVILKNGTAWAAKVLVIKAAGLVGDQITSGLRKDMITLAKEVIQNFLKQEEILSMLADFFAINKAQGLNKNCGFTLEFYVLSWLSSDRIAKGHRWCAIKKDLFNCAFEQGLGQALGKLAGPGLAVSLGAVACHGIDLTQKYVNIKSNTTLMCEAIRGSLKEHLRAMDFGYILTHFCGLTEEQVEKLNLGNPCAAADNNVFNADRLPADAEGFDFISSAELQHAAKSLVYLCSLRDEVLRGNSNQVSSLIATLSAFVVDEMIGSMSWKYFKVHSSAVTPGYGARRQHENELKFSKEPNEINDHPSSSGTHVAIRTPGNSTQRCSLTKFVAECPDNLPIFRRVHREPAEGLNWISKAVLFIEKLEIDIQIVDSRSNVDSKVVFKGSRSPRAWALVISFTEDLLVELVEVLERKDEPGDFKRLNFSGPHCMTEAFACITGKTINEVQEELLELANSNKETYSKLLGVFDSLLTDHDTNKRKLCLDSVLPKQTKLDPSSNVSKKRKIQTD